MTLDTAQVRILISDLLAALTYHRVMENGPLMMQTADGPQDIAARLTEIQDLFIQDDLDRAGTASMPVPATAPEPEEELEVPELAEWERELLGMSAEAEEEEPTVTADLTPFANPAQEFAEALNVRFGGKQHRFHVMRGRKYHRVVITDGRRPQDGGSVHAFVDNDGNVYKADSWKKPAVGVRALARNAAELHALISSLGDHDWAGGYLYAR